VKKGKLGFSRFYKANLRLKAVGIWIALAPFIGNQRILTPVSVVTCGVASASFDYICKGYVGILKHLYLNNR
jgi:hypothetical protein